MDSRTRLGVVWWLALTGLLCTVSAVGGCGGSQPQPAVEANLQALAVLYGRYIQQHQGKGLISYFYQKAKEQSLKKGKKSFQIKEDDFRYPGPKPQTKEAGLVMLADMVEAASRSLVDPTPARIQGTVQKIINRVFSDGQLDECELTLKDLHEIAKSFNRL